MGRAAKSWVKRVRPHFDFLEEEGFRLDRVDDEWWATMVHYVSSTLGVKVTRSVEFDLVETSPCSDWSMAASRSRRSGCPTAR